MSSTKSPIVRFLQQERILFVLANRIPRRLATRFMGWFGRIEVGIVRDLSIAVWRRFADDLRLDEAKKDRFTSLHDCFVREWRDGARPIDEADDVVVSPCDAVVGAHGTIERGRVYQAKGLPYSLEELFGGPTEEDLLARHEDGVFVTLRLKSSMVHRFFAPQDGRVERVTYVSGDMFNVDPISVRRIERLFCRNERAVVPLVAPPSAPRVTLVAVAAILVAGIRLHCLGGRDPRRAGANRFFCDAAYRKGDEMGYFQHGSTILVFASGPVKLDPELVEGRVIRMGRPLLRVVPESEVPRVSPSPTSRPAQADVRTDSHSLPLSPEIP